MAMIGTGETPVAINIRENKVVDLDIRVSRIDQHNSKQGLVFASNCHS